MARHRHRSRSTHTATFYGDRVIGEDELGEDLIESDAELVTAPVRFIPGGQGFVQEATGERVYKAPTLSAPPYIHDLVDEGNEVVLEGVDATFLITNIRQIYGRRRRAPEALDLEVEKIDG